MALKDKFKGKGAKAPEAEAAAPAAEAKPTQKIAPAAKAEPKANAQAKAAQAGAAAQTAVNGAKVEPKASASPKAGAAPTHAQPAAHAQPKAQPATHAKPAPKAQPAANADPAKAGFTPVHQPGPAGQKAPAKAAPRGVAEAAAKRSVGIRRVKMTIQKIEPLSILKIGFLLSVAMGIMIVVAMMILWFVLDAMHVFAQVNDLFETLNSEQLLQIAAYLSFGRWMSFAVIIAIIDVVLFTALSAVAALVYNLVAALVGGLHITVTDE